MPTLPGRRTRSLAAAVLALALAACPAADPPAPPARPLSTAVTDRVRIFLIAPRDGGRAGRAAGCGDSAVPVEVTLPAPAPALEGALGALLAGSQRVDSPSGLLHPLYASALRLAGVDRVGGEARVRLAGYLELGDACEGRRILAELDETARQFADVRRATFTVDGRPLAELLAEAAPAPAGTPAGP